MSPQRRAFTAPLLIGAIIGLSGCETNGGTAPTDLAGLAGVLGEIGQIAGGESGLTAYEIEAGLREALIVGTGRVADSLGQTDGYFGDPNVRIPLPGELGDLQQTLSRVGLSGPLDDLQVRLNRGAEAAIPQAETLVVNAIKALTVEDAVSILRGADDAATQYLRDRTEVGLRSALTPYLRNALEESGAYSSLDRVASSNGLGALSTQLRDDLTESAVNAGLDGLFLYVASEEQRIREEPVARTTELLRKVFGANNG